MNEVNSHEQSHIADTFIEPHVRPDVDSYIRDKLEEAFALKGKMTPRNVRPRAQGTLLDEKVSLEILAKLNQKGDTKRAGELTEVRGITGRDTPKNYYPVGQWRTNLDDFAKYVLKGTTPEAEIQRLQEVWSAVARGDFTGVSTEIAQDISVVTNELNERRQSTEPDIRADVERYDTSVAELAEWQASLQEAPLDVNTRLGKQINKTVVGLIQQRDSTKTGKLNKQLKTFERVQKTITTLPHLPAGR